MLTRDLLLNRTRDGKITPSFIRVEDPSLIALAEQIVSHVQSAIGEPSGTLEETLQSVSGAYPKPKVAKGLCKLAMDRTVLEEPLAEVGTARAERFRSAAALLRHLSSDAMQSDYESALAQHFSRPLHEVRDGLYADLPARRKITAWDPLDAKTLLNRYNMALAQGPLLFARSVTIRALIPELLRVRQLLRWLRFCRLVAQVERVGTDWTLSVEGPAAMFSLQKKYGLQMATFLTGVPVLKHWELTADLKMPRGERRMVLSHRDPLVSSHSAALGHIPDELRGLAQGFEGTGWEVELTPMPRHVGATGVSVPDLTLRREGREVAVELFHPWHKGALARRLKEIASRADGEWLLGVDRSLAKDPHEREALEANPNVFLFNAFPSPKRILERLE